MSASSPCPLARCAAVGVIAVTLAAACGDRESTAPTRAPRLDATFSAPQPGPDADSVVVRGRGAGFDASGVLALPSAGCESAAARLEQRPDTLVLRVTARRRPDAAACPGVITTVRYLVDVRDVPAGSYVVRVQHEQVDAAGVPTRVRVVATGRLTFR